MESIDRATRIRNLNPGNVDAWRGPYNSKDEACRAVPNLWHDGQNVRLGKIVDIWEESGLVSYWWKRGFNNEDLRVYNVPDIEIVEEAIGQSRFITLTGDQLFSFSNDLQPMPDKEFVTLTATEHNFIADPGNRLWEYLDSKGFWRQIDNTFNTLTINIRHDSYLFEGRNAVSVRYRVGERLDQLEIVKLYAGQSAIQVQVQSDFGNIFQNGNIDTVLRAVVSYGGEIITDSIPEEAFTWTRTSYNQEDDRIWNESHKAHQKTIKITDRDVWQRADFTCSVELEISKT